MSEPLKWKKRILLAKFGIRRIEEIERELMRFDKSRIDELLNTVKSQIQTDQNSILIYVKPNELSSRNKSLQTEKDFSVFKESVNDEFKTAQEIWVVGSCDNNGLAYGRALYNDGRPLCIELLKGLPRKIDSKKFGDGMPYARFERNSFLPHFHLKQVDGAENEDITKYKEQVIRSLDEIKNGTDYFTDFLKGLDMDDFSLDLRIERGRIVPFDWDTKNNLKVLHSADEHFKHWNGWGNTGMRR